MPSFAGSHPDYRPRPPIHRLRRPPSPNPRLVEFVSVLQGKVDPATNSPISPSLRCSKAKWAQVPSSLSPLVFAAPMRHGPSQPLPYVLLSSALRVEVGRVINFPISPLSQVLQGETGSATNFPIYSCLRYSEEKGSGDEEQRIKPNHATSKISSTTQAKNR